MRRTWSQIGVLSLLALTCAFVGPAHATRHQNPKEFTEWGWPQPYEKISEKSVKWLKDRGWWPIKYAYQPLWLGQNVIKVAGDMGFASKRGLEVEFVPFISGPAVNEAIIGGTVQAGGGGPFPTITMVSRNAPIKGVAVVSYGHRHALMSPADSPLRQPADIKGKTIGMLVGAGTEYAYVVWAKGNRLEPYKDAVLKNMSGPEMMTLPRGIDFVVLWDPLVELVEKERKTARLFADTTDYMYYFASLYLRDEIIHEVPEVAQAIVDTFIETILYSRFDPKKTAELIKRDEALQSYPSDLLQSENQAYVNNLKPTWTYPFAEYIAVEADRVARWLHSGRRIKTEVRAEQLRAHFVRDFMDRTYRKLGWKIPAQPPYFAPGTTVERLRGWASTDTMYQQLLPYRLTTPQEFPEPADLAAPWYFRGKWYAPR